ncbi:hypothetical protein M8542_06215 [Amycolatopsis sp. OK19-0408]|uniref:Uncharacterized protein n=1 Tax=Amycolatopsis iheyensis TaxID=2945988 RepID=A0A9X2N7M9_9PSEU|nr:hypothetical protein [Amycolatopsis iheyensis]MCR6482402.1 hypothetical protein [Amycolatopsis iheyensis]
MRGDWIYDWVRVEMEYRAGPAPAVRRERPAARHWTTLWAGLFTSHSRTEVRAGTTAAGC